VIFCYLRDIERYLVTVGYICYHGNNHVIINERRPSRIEIEKRQGMQVLGAYLSPSMSVKYRFAICPHVMLNAASHLAGRINCSDREA
jgi:hypothetical protein